MNSPTTMPNEEMIKNQLDAMYDSVEGEEQITPRQVQMEELSDVERKLDVEISWEDVKKRLDEAYRELQHGVSIKGFRRGKVPRKMLEQLFGKHVNREVSQRIVQDSLGKAFLDKSLAPVSEPKIEDQGLKDGESFHYTATVQVVPPIEPKDYFDIEVKIYEPEITDKDVEEALLAKQREHTDFRTIEGRNTQAGDVLLVDLMGKIDNEPYAKEMELIEISDPPREPLPGLAAALTGIPANKQEMSIEFNIPEHPHAEGEPSPAGEATKKARLLVTIKEMKQKVVPEIDDELARDTGEAETLAELREVLRKKLLSQGQERAKDEAKQELLKEIINRNTIPLIPALVERHLEQSFHLQMAAMGIDPDSLAMDKEAIKEKVRPEATHAVKSALVLEAIAKKENIEVQDADVEQRLAQMAAERGQNIARVRSEYDREGRMTMLRSRIREDKTLDLLMSKAKIVIEKKPTGAEPDKTE